MKLKHGYHVQNSLFYNNLPLWFDQILDIHLIYLSIHSLIMLNWSQQVAKIRSKYFTDQHLLVLKQDMWNSWAWVACSVKMYFISNKDA